MGLPFSHGAFQGRNQWWWEGIPNSGRYETHWSAEQGGIQSYWKRPSYHDCKSTPSYGEKEKEQRKGTCLRLQLLRALQVLCIPYTLERRQTKAHQSSLFYTDVSSSHPQEETNKSSPASPLLYTDVSSSHLQEAVDEGWPDLALLYNVSFSYPQKEADKGWPDHACSIEISTLENKFEMELSWLKCLYNSIWVLS